MTQSVHDDARQSEGDSPPRRRRGLVLEGGGAKGAFQYGALSVFFEKGIQFDVVAGTSVGALNACIWATRELRLADELWRNLSFGAVFRVRWLLGMIAIATLPARLYVERHRIYVPVYVRMSFGLIRRMPMLAVAALGLYGLALMEVEGGDFLWRFLAYVVFPLASAPRMYTKMVLFSYAMGVGAYLGLRSAGAAEGWVGGIALLGALPFVVWLVGHGTRGLNTSVFEAGPLGEVVSRLAPTKPLVPILATVARVVDFVDPDRVQYDVPLGAPAFLATSPMAQNHLVAEYLRLDEATATDRAAAMMASAALPLGILPYRRMSRSGLKSGPIRKLPISKFPIVASEVVDGGAVDNCPWFPLIADLPCDEIVVLRCRPGSWDETKARREWRERDRIRRVAASGFEGYSNPTGAARDNPENPTAIPYREPPTWPVRVSVVAPARSLGGLFMGTLNFSTGRARKNIAAGREAAEALLGVYP